MKEEPRDQVLPPCQQAQVATIALTELMPLPAERSTVPQFCSTFGEFFLRIQVYMLLIYSDLYKGEDLSRNVPTATRPRSLYY